MTSSNENIFRVTVLLWWGSTGHRWIPPTKASDVELWCFHWSAPKQTGEQTIETLVIWEAIALIMTSLQLDISTCNEYFKYHEVSRERICFRWSASTVQNDRKGALRASEIPRKSSSYYRSSERRKQLGGFAALNVSNETLILLVFA